MKTKNIVLLTSVCALLLFATLTFVNDGDKKNVTEVSAQDLADKAFTPAPFATSVPNAITQIMQQYARSEIITRTVHGVEMSAANFRVEDGILMADICYQLPSNEDWFADVRARFGNTEVGATRITTYDRVRTSPNGEQYRTTFFGDPPRAEIKDFPPGSFPISYLCETHKMQLESETPPAHIVLVVYSISFSPREGQGCSHLDEIQGILDVKGAGIKLDCTQSEGRERASIRQKPANMSEEEAWTRVREARQDVFWIKGPWVFEGEVMNMNDPAASVEPLATELPIDSAMPPKEAVTLTP